MFFVGKIFEDYRQLNMVKMEIKGYKSCVKINNLILHDSKFYKYSQDHGGVIDV